MLFTNGIGFRKTALATLVVLGVPLLAACDGEGAAERASEKIDNAVSEATKFTGNALEKVGETIQETSQNARDALKDGAQNVENGTEKAGDEIENKAEEVEDSVESQK